MKLKKLTLQICDDFARIYVHFDKACSYYKQLSQNLF